MKFSENLNKYIDITRCSAKELSKLSGLSETVISRYRKGERVPKYKSAQLDLLILSLSKLAKDKNLVDINEESIRKDLESDFEKNDIDFEVFRENFNLIIKTLNVNVANISKYIGYDSSYLSKIRAGIRKPQNIENFVSAICRYIIANYYNTKYNDEIKSLINCKSSDLENKDILYEKLYFWFTNNSNSVNKAVEEYNIDRFLYKLDEFDLNNYIKDIKFDKIKVPTLPKGLPKSKAYYGLAGFKASQIDALKQIVLSKSKEDVFFYSNMAMIESSKDLDFTKKFMMGLAFMLKKGLKLNMIHNLDRPFEELMLGLEGWIPLYMTGQIVPFYFNDNSNDLFSQIECVAGSVALSGSCVTGNINNAKLIVTNKKEEVEYYKKNARLLLKKANSLMEIYDGSKKREFAKIIEKNKSIKGNRRNILVDLPIYTLSDNLLSKILDRNNVSKAEKESIISSVQKEKNNVKEMLQKGKIFDEISILSKEEFEKSGYKLDLSKYFYNKTEIKYSYEDYKEHIAELEKFKEENKNYDYKINEKNVFKNINIHIIENKQVIISKTNLPIIHFVIHYPKLVNAIGKFKGK